MECVCETGGNGQVVVVFLVVKCNLILLDIQMLVINVFEATRTIRGKEKGNTHQLKISKLKPEV